MPKRGENIHKRKDGRCNGLYCTEVEAMFYLNQWKDAFKSESFTAKNIRTDRQTEVLPVGKKHYAVIVAFLALRYMSISWLIY